MSSNRLIQKQFESKQPEQNNPADFKHLDEVKKDGTESALEAHMKGFAGSDGYVDAKSIHDACIRANFTEKDASSVATNTMRGAYFSGVPGVSYSLCTGIQGHFKPKEAVPLMTHPKDSGIYDRKTGKFNDELFKILADKYALIDSDGEKIISKAKMHEFIEKETNPDQRWKDASWFSNHLGQIGNKGEFDLLYQQVTSRYKLNKETNAMEGFITLTDLKLWYQDTQLVLDKMHQHELPAPPPLKRL